MMHRVPLQVGLNVRNGVTCIYLVVLPFEGYPFFAEEEEEVVGYLDDDDDEV